ncbi:MAG TPA: right-handed parallel beta-helix repeat-containing protein [Armatimonadota bacterium]|jgi:hypothetical protein
MAHSRSASASFGSLLAALVVTLLPPRSQCDVLFVNKNATGAVHDGASWATAFLSVQAGVHAAPSGGEVWVAKGVYGEFVAIAKPVTLLGGFVGSETRSEQRDPLGVETAIVAEPDAGIAAVTLTTTASGSTVDGFTIAHDGSGAPYTGPGLVCDAAGCTISHNLIRANTGDQGGGIRCTASGVVIAGNVIRENSSPSETDARGGGIYVSGRSPVIRDNRIEGNAAVGSMWGYPGESASAWGGGIYCAGDDAVIIGNTVRSNTLYSIGGCMVGPCSAVAESVGAGICCLGSGALLERNTITDNAAEAHAGSRLGGYETSVGGVAMGGAAVLRDCLIARNTALSDFNAFPGVQAAAGAVIANNTIVNHSGDAVTLAGSGTVINNIIASNTTGVNAADTAPIVAHNCFFGNGANAVGLPDPAGQNGNIEGAPLFASATDFRLAAASPCVDAGENSAVTPGEADLDGKPRKQGGSVDIGCYEFPKPTAYALGDVIGILKVAAGIWSGAPDAMIRLNPEAPLDRVSLADAVRIIRKVTGLEANP